jgi:hypothetical protein
MKNTQIINLLFVCTLLPITLSAQKSSTVVTIEDISAPDSPIRISGQAILVEEINITDFHYKFNVDATLTNVSSQPLLCYNVVIDVVSSSALGEKGNFTDDRFFSDEMIMQPGSATSVQYGPTAWRSVSLKSGEASAGSRHVKARVVFAQLADGTRFGDAKFEQQLRADRTGTVADLTSAIASYEKGTPLATSIKNVSANSKASFVTINSTVLNHLKDSLNTKGSTETLAEMKKFLTNADKRKAYM